MLKKKVESPAVFLGGGDVMHNLPIRNKKNFLSLICFNSLLTFFYSQDHFETRFETNFFLYTSIHFDTKFALFTLTLRQSFCFFSPKKLYCTWVIQNGHPAPTTTKTTSSSL